MAKRGFDSTDSLQFMNYAWPVIGYKSLDHAGGTTCAVALATIEATDIVLAQYQATATSAYVLKVAVTAGTGFVATSSAAIGKATLSYVIYKQNF